MIKLLTALVCVNVHPIFKVQDFFICHIINLILINLNLINLIFSAVTM